MFFYKKEIEKNELVSRLGVGMSGSDPGGVVNGGATSEVLGKQRKMQF